MNDRILSGAGCAWYDCLGFDAGGLDTPAKATALTLILASLMVEFSSERLLLIKDPRLCLLLGLWLPALRELKISPAVLLVLRHPSEVVASLARRESLPPALTTALWLRYMLTAEVTSRACPRHILLYDVLLRDWRSALQRAGSEAQVAWPVAFDTAATQMDSFLETGLRHHYAFSPSAQSVGAPLGPWADEVYETLLALDAKAGDAPQLWRLDRVRAAFGDWCRDHGCAWSAKLLAGHTVRAGRKFEISADWEAIISNQAAAGTGPHLQA